MNFPAVGRRLQELLVVVAALAVSAYAAWVVYDFRHSTSVEATKGDAVAAPAGGRSPKASPSVEPTPTRPPSLKPFATAVAAARDILVVGDSTGDEPGEWVSLWAQDTASAQDRQVSLQQWDPVGQSFTEFRYGSDGRPLTIWNLSYRTDRADYAARLGAVKPTPDAVLLNIGHDRSPEELDASLNALGKGLEKRWGDVPVAWTLQNPSTGTAAQQQETAVKHLRQRAVKEQVPVIDVHGAFIKHGNLASLLLDGARPNNAGSALWAQTLEAALRR